MYDLIVHGFYYLYRLRQGRSRNTRKLLAVAWLAHAHMLDGDSSFCRKYCTIVLTHVKVGCFSSILMPHILCVFPTIGWMMVAHHCLLPTELASLIEIDNTVSTHTSVMLCSRL